MAFVVALPGSARQTEVTSVRVRNASIDRQEHHGANTFFKSIIHTYHHLRRRRFDKRKAESIRLIQKKKRLLVHVYRITDHR